MIVVLYSLDAGKVERYYLNKDVLKNPAVFFRAVRTARDKWAERDIVYHFNDIL